MSKASLNIQEPDRLNLSGKLTFSTISTLQRQLQQALEEHAKLSTINLQDITRVDSAGLALLIDLLRLSAKQGRVLQFVQVPEQLLAMLKVSSLDKLPLFAKAFYHGNP